MNPNRINASGATPANAFEDENKAQIKASLLKAHPLYRYQGIDQMVDAIWKGSNWQQPDGQSRQSDALQGDGQVVNSDLNQNAQQQAGFFGDMESFRKKEMADKTALSPTTDPEDDRYFGEEQASPGQAWLRQMQRSEVETQGGGQTPESDEPGLEAGQIRPAGAQSLELKAGSPAGQKWFRNIPAAGRFGRTR
jgi:hypothetical protein